MQDKYTRLEEKVDEGRRRGGCVEKCFEDTMRCGEGELESFLGWEMVGVKENENGFRINIVEVKCKSSTVRFVLNQKIQEVQNKFGNDFLDNNGNRELLSLRIR